MKIAMVFAFCFTAVNALATLQISSVMPEVYQFENVPVYVYHDETRTLIGSATVSFLGGEISIDANITHPVALEMGLDNVPFLIGYDMQDNRVYELAVRLQPSVQRIDNHEQDKPA